MATPPFDENQVRSMLAGSLTFFTAYNRAESPQLLKNNLIKNAFHPGMGRGSYFPKSSGPTEGQALVSKASMTAFEATGDVAWKNLAIATGEALITSYYNGPIPANPQPTDPVWLPHWLINVVGSFVSKGTVAPDPFNNGHFGVLVNFTDGVGAIATGDPTWGEKLSDVYKIYSTDGALLYQNIYAPLLSGTAYEIDYWVTNFMLEGTNYRTYPESAASNGTRPTVTAEAAGTIKLKTAFTGQLKVVYMSYTGPAIAEGQLFEPYPGWRALQPGEYQAAFDVFWWAHDAFELLHKHTNDEKWQRAIDANKYTTLNAAIVNNPSYFYEKSDSPNPLRTVGSQIVQANNPNGYTASRVTAAGSLQNWLQIDVAAAPVGNFPSIEIQNYVVQVAFTESVTVYAETAHSLGDVIDVVVSLSSNAFDFTQLYIAQWIVAGGSVPTTKTFVASDLVKWPTTTLWHPSVADDPIFTFSGNGGTVAIAREQVQVGINSPVVWRIDLTPNSGFAGAGLVLVAGTTTQPPQIRYASTGIIRLRLTDSTDAYWYTDMPNTGGVWSTFEPTWAAFTGTGTPAAGNIKEIVFESQGEATTLYLYYVGTDPLRLPTPCTGYKASLTSRTKTAHTFYCGNFQAIGSQLDQLRYQPGVVPFTVNVINGEIDAWRGVPYLGYQSPVHYYLWGRADLGQQVLGFIKDAQIAYTRQSAANIVGLVAQTYLWAYWDSADFTAFGQLNTFSFSGPDPNTRWSPYTFRLMEAVGRAALVSGSNDAKSIVRSFLQYIDSYYTANNAIAPITDIPPITSPQSNYNEPHAAALIGRAAIFANVAGVDPEVTIRIIQKSYDFVVSQYIDAGSMAGSFALGQPTFTSAGTEYREYFGFWHAEIVEFLAVLLLYKDQLKYPFASQAGFFPSIPPDKLAIASLPNYATQINSADDGTEQRISAVDVGMGLQLTLEYNFLTATQFGLLMNFWAEVGGTSLSFGLPDVVWQYHANIKAAIARMGGTSDWRFAQGFNLTTNYATTSNGIYTCKISLISLIEPGSSGYPVPINTEILDYWKFAGYREGQAMPTGSQVGWNLDASSSALWGSNAIAANGTDQSVKLQNIIDQIPNLYPARNYGQLVRLLLPAGTIRINKQIVVHPSFLIIAGRGSDPNTGTKIVFLPDTDTRYDVPLSGGSNDGDDFELSTMTFGADANGGWIFPGRACFRFQSKRVHLNYELEFASAPANRKDFYFGSYNFPWRSGLKVKQSPAYAARTGGTLIPLEDDPINIYPGSYVLLYAANTRTMYNQQGVTNTNHHRDTPIVRQRIYRVTVVDTINKAIAIDRPLEFDVPANQLSDGDTAMSSDSSYFSLIVPLDAVIGSGIEDLYLEQPMDTAPKLSDGTPYNLSPSQADYNYNNLAPEYAIHGVAFKWAVNCWARRIKTYMTGSHAIVSELTKNLQIEDCHFEGSWNKGKGGNGYLRLSKAWDTLFQRNVIRQLRHLTLQWSSSYCVLKNNDITCDLNLHGGQERLNLIEQNTAIVPYQHRFGTITSDPSQGSNWFPIWYGAGLHAGKWSSSTGEQNFFFNNLLRKQVVPGGSFDDYAPYSDRAKVYIIGSDALGKWKHLQINGSNIPTWSTREQINYSIAPNAGVIVRDRFDVSLHDAAKASVRVLPSVPDYPGASFSPSSLPGYAFHISGKDSVKSLDSSSKVISASDLSGKGNTATAFSSTARPALATLNGFNTFLFGGNTGLVVPQTVVTSGVITWILLVKTSATTASRERILEVLWSDRSYQYYPTGDFTQTLLAFFSGTTFVDGITTSSNENPKGTWRAVAFTVNYSLTKASLWVDGAFTRRNLTGVTAPTGTFTKATIGRRNNGLDWFNGEVAEAIACQAELKPAQQYDAMRWMLKKYLLNG